MRVFIGFLLVAHGLLHMIGVAKGFGLAPMAQLTQPISRAMAVVWLAAAVLCVVTAFLPLRWFWFVGLAAVIVSQLAISGSWADARFGTIPNVIVLLAVVYAFAAHGPFSMAAQYRRQVESSWALSGRAEVLSEHALRALPSSVARYVRLTGAVGQPLPRNVRVHWRGRIRSGPDAPWMPFVAEQVNTFGVMPGRLFYMDAVMKGLPVKVYHRFVGEHAGFNARLLALFPVAGAKGPDMDRAETVTLLNDLCIMAPGALVDPSLHWQASDSVSAHVSYTRGKEVVTATLLFDANGMMVDFVSDDRAQAVGADGAITRMRWSTPLQAPRTYGAMRLASGGSARWHEANGKDYAYIELEMLDWEPDVAGAGPSTRSD